MSDMIYAIKRRLSNRSIGAKSHPWSWMCKGATKPTIWSNMCFDISHRLNIFGLKKAKEVQKSMQSDTRYEFRIASIIRDKFGDLRNWNWIDE